VNDSININDPIKLQFLPSPQEALPDPFALNDPLGELHYRKTPRLTHQYYDRALIITCYSCAGYCRHCFRRTWVSQDSLCFINDQELTLVLDYLKKNPQIKELLLSGGDPLVADNETLENLLGRIRKAFPNMLLRVCTRMPVTEPSRLNSETIELLAKHKPLRVAAHLHHPNELSAESRGVFRSLIDADLKVYTQTVLLKKINNDPAILENLFKEIIEMGLLPYYLFQLDLAPGIAHFRVPLKTGLAIYKELEKRLCGRGLPAYALDLPGGGGKIRLHEKTLGDKIYTDRGQAYVLKDAHGGKWLYPAQ
jgi:lysine 2,3-aminomutase